MLLRPSPPEDLVLETTTSLMDSVNRGNAVEALSHFVVFDDRQSDILATKVDSWVKDGVFSTASILGVSCTGSCAVVVLQQSRSDYDPIFLLKRDGMWRVLPEPTDFRSLSAYLSDSTIESYNELYSWYGQQVPNAPPLVRPTSGTGMEAAIRDLIEEGSPSSMATARKMAEYKDLDFDRLVEKYQRK